MTVIHGHNEESSNGATLAVDEINTLQFSFRNSTGFFSKYEPLRQISVICSKYTLQWKLYS